MSELLDAIVRHGLSDTSIKNEVIAYLRAETAKITPPSEWREVWRDISKPRLYEDKHQAQIMGMAKAPVTKVTLLLLAYHNDHQRIGKLTGYIIPEREFDEDYRAFDMYHHKTIYTEPIAAVHYTETIRYAQGDGLKQALDAFNELTMPINE